MVKGGQAGSEDSDFQLWGILRRWRLTGSLGQPNDPHARFLSSWFGERIPSAPDIRRLFLRLESQDAVEFTNGLTELLHQEWNVEPLSSVAMQHTARSLRAMPSASLEETVESCATLLGFVVRGMRGLAGSVDYLGPLREEPRVVYTLGSGTRHLSVGARGEYTAYLLDRDQRQKCEYRSPDGAERSADLVTAVSEWVAYLGVGDRVSVIPRGKLGHSLSLDVNGTARDLTTIGVGASQILPVIVMVLAAAPNRILAFEQPELHLHPAVQARLADFFLMARRDLRFLIETHSEYLVSRIRRRIAEGMVYPTDVSVIFAEQRDGVWRFNGSTWTNSETSIVGLRVSSTKEILMAWLLSGRSLNAWMNTKDLILTIRLLLDPRLLDPPTTDARDAWIGFWSRLAKWSVDDRVGLGPASRKLACDRLAVCGWPQRRLVGVPQALTHDGNRALIRFTARGPFPSDSASARSFDPAYLGSAAEARALGCDVAGLALDDAGVGIASDPGHWSARVADVICSPPPPDVAVLCFIPNEAVAAEQRDRVRQGARAMRILIVGKQREPRIVQRIYDEISPRDVTWLPCENHKPPRLSRLNSISGSDTVVVCVTGGVGHATSLKLREITLGADAIYREVERASEICGVLEELLLATSPRVGRGARGRPMGRAIGDCGE